jgi:hypothetical protein
METESQNRQKRIEEVEAKSSQIQTAADETSISTPGGIDEDALAEFVKNFVLEDERKTLREKYTPRLFGIITTWLGIVVLFVFLSALRFDYFNFNNPECHISCVGFKLSDSVLIAFITSTTVSVLGLFLVVANWMYPSASRKNDKDKKEG